MAPNLGDAESLLNAILVKMHGIGDDIGQIEYMKKYGIEEIEKSYTNYNFREYLDMQPKQYLHELIV